MSTRRAWRAAVVLAAGLAVPASSAGGTPEEIGLRVRIDNPAGVPPGALSRALSEVEEIFAAADVRIEWRTNNDGGTACGADRILTLHVVKVEPATGQRRYAVLGLAARPSRRAFVFYDRLLDAAASHPIDLAVVLGQVMAHELGHLLLPPGPHPPFGLMRGNLEFGAPRPRRFSETEARQLRSAVRSGREVARSTPC
jgi:hypothetical protein